MDEEELQVTHERDEEGYRITVYKQSGELMFSWLMGLDDAYRFLVQMQNTLGLA